jgi:hypothetical protein
MSIAKTSPFETKLVLLVGDLAQLPPICKHTLRQNDILCKCCHVKSTPYWKMAQQHFLSILSVMPQIKNTYNFLTPFEKENQPQMKFRKFYHHFFYKFKK